MWSILWVSSRILGHIQLTLLILLSSFLSGVLTHVLFRILSVPICGVPSVVVVGLRVPHNVILLETQDKQMSCLRLGWTPVNNSSLFSVGTWKIQRTDERVILTVWVFWHYLVSKLLCSRHEQMVSLTFKNYCSTSRTSSKQMNKMNICLMNWTLKI